MKTMRRSSLSSKKGCLERIYKNWTIPKVMERSGGRCVLCGQKAECGHHVFGRSKDYLHIHPAFVVAVCLKCHSAEKGLDPIKRANFLNKTLDKITDLWYKEDRWDLIESTVEDRWLPTIDIERVLIDFAIDKLVEAGFWGGSNAKNKKRV